MRLLYNGNCMGRAQHLYLRQLNALCNLTISLAIAFHLKAELSADVQFPAVDRHCVHRRNTARYITAVSYTHLVYLIGRLIWCDRSNVSLLGWLVSAKLSGSNSYLYGWLLSSNLFWIAMAISAVPSLFGKHRFSFVTLIAFAPVSYTHLPVRYRSSQTGRACLPPFGYKRTQ